MGSKFILASASPRRKELLSQAGFEFEIIPAEIDETPKLNEPPHDYVLRLSLEKARKIGGKLPVLGADTVVSIDGVLLGKPGNPAEAFLMLKRLVAKPHFVHTGVSIVSSHLEQSVVTATEVRFNTVSDDELNNYIATGEPFDKAGGYGIQGIGAFLVDSINGSYTGVVGLPIDETIELLERFSIRAL